MTEDIMIEKWPITLTQFLKWQGLAENGSFAKRMVKEGDVAVNEKICTVAGLKLSENDLVQIRGMQERFRVLKANSQKP